MSTHSKSRAAAWLEQRHYRDLDPRAERTLREAGLQWSNEPEAERLLAEAQQLAPDHMAVAVAQYRYNLYKHRFRVAVGYAERCLSLAASRVGLAEDFRSVSSGDADFGSSNPELRFWLFALQAYGYVLLRCDRGEEGMAALRKVVALDKDDQTKTRVLVQVIERAGQDPELD